MKYLILFEEFSLPLHKPVEPKKTSHATDIKDDELTEEEIEATDLFLKQYDIGHEENSVRNSHKNARYRTM
jgi:hypothetical protein